MVGAVLHVGAIRLQLSILLEGLVVRALKLGEAPLLGHVDLLAARELELCTAQRLDDSSLVLIGSTDAHDGLANVDSGNSALRLAEGSSHSSLEPISSGTAQHFVDAHHVEGVYAHTNVERIFAAVLDEVLVGANAAGL